MALAAIVFEPDVDRWHRRPIEVDILLVEIGVGRRRRDAWYRIEMGRGPDQVRTDGVGEPVLIGGLGAQGRAGDEVAVLGHEDRIVVGVLDIPADALAAVDLERDPVLAPGIDDARQAEAIAHYA